MKKIFLLSALLVLTTVVMKAQNPAGCQHGNAGGHEMMKQCGSGHCLDMIPGLTEDQKKQIKTKGIAMHKEIAVIESQINEKKAHLNTLELADSPDMAAIGKTVDEMMVLKAELMKKKIAHHQEIRKMLNDEQKMVFDKHCGQGKCKGKKGHGSSCCGGGAQHHGQSGCCSGQNTGNSMGCGNHGAGSGCGSQGSGSGCKGTGK